MKRLIFGAVMAATAMTAVPATAQQNWREREARREYREDVREARQDRNRALRQARRNEWSYGRRYDYNRVDPYYGGYYADRYYREGRYYQPRRLSYNDRVYRGNDGRYYCRRSDGTTGLILGAGAGALLGNSIDRGRSSALGTILGAIAGGAIGNSIDRNSVTCR
jgi:Ni/Co efflux regulator RcnB